MQISMDVFILYPSILLIVFSFLIHKWFLGKIEQIGTKAIKLPPSPPKLPIIGNIHQLNFDIHRSLWSLAKQYGRELMLIHLGSTPFLIVSSSQAAREIIKNHDAIFCNRAGTRTSRKLLYNNKDVASSHYGEHWRQMKSICVFHLLSNKNVASFRRVREEETSLLMNKIMENSNEVINLRDLLVTFTKDVTCKVALGRKCTRDFFKFFQEFTKLIGSVRVGDFVPWLTWVDKLDGWDAKVEKFAKEFDHFVENVVKEHEIRSHKDKDDKERVLDFIDVLINIQKGNNSFDQIPIERDSIKALLVDVLLAGTGSTFILLEWAMSELLRHPKIMQELQREVREIAGNKSKVDEEDLNQMKYLKAVIKETLPLHPVVPLIPRLSTKDVKIKGYEIPQGTSVLINCWAIHRDPSFWENPEKFNPKRFLSCSVDFRGQDFDLIPFGAGRRICPGISFAVVINELVLANLMHKFDWVLPGEVNGESLDMSEDFGITVQRKTPLLAVATIHD